MFFTTEHSRINGLKRELGKPKNFELLTSKKLNNKFALAKVVFDPLPAKDKTDKKGGNEAKPKAAKATLSGAQGEVKPVPSATTPAMLKNVRKGLGPLPRPSDKKPQ